MNAIRHQLIIHRNLNHPNIVKFIQYWQTQKNFYIFQEYCNGGNIRNFLTQYKKFQESDAVLCLESVCKGFQELVKNAVLHRDIKPQNLLIKNGMIKIADFGLSKKVHTRKQLNQSVVGTPLYMSPQILQSQRYSSKCDIWSIGILFYQMLYGKHPWTGNTQLTLVKNIKQISLKFPNDPIVSQNAKDFIRNCLKLQENQRISWLQIFDHPIFQNRLKQISIKWQKAYQKAAQRLQILSKEINTQKLIGVFFRFNSINLDYDQFYLVMKWLLQQSQKTNLQKSQSNPQQQKELQIAIMYQMFDKDLNGVIDIQQFVGQFQICHPRILQLLKGLIEKQFKFEDLQNKKIFMKESRLFFQDALQRQQLRIDIDIQKIIQNAYDIIDHIQLE